LLRRAHHLPCADCADDTISNCHITMTLRTITPILFLLALPFVATACSHSSYTPLPDALMACNKIIDWSEQQACRQKAEKYNEDWQKRNNAAR